MATRLARGNALVVVEHLHTWRLTGWAGATGALNLDTGETADLDPRLREHLEHLVRFGNNGYARGFGRDGAHRALADMHADGLLERDVVLSVLSAFDISPTRPAGPRRPDRQDPARRRAPLRARGYAGMPAIHA